MLEFSVIFIGFILAVSFILFRLSLSELRERHARYFGKSSEDYPTVMDVLINLKKVDKVGFLLGGVGIGTVGTVYSTLVYVSLKFFFGVIS